MPDFLGQIAALERELTSEEASKLKMMVEDRVGESLPHYVEFDAEKVAEALRVYGVGTFNDIVASFCMDVRQTRGWRPVSSLHGVLVTERQEPVPPTLILMTKVGEHEEKINTPEGEKMVVTGDKMRVELFAQMSKLSPETRERVFAEIKDLPPLDMGELDPQTLKEHRQNMDKLESRSEVDAEMDAPDPD